MLVLTRKEGECIFVGEDITLKILSIHNRNLRIGITAPEHIQILRDDAIRRRKLDLTGQVHPALLTRNLREFEL